MNDAATREAPGARAPRILCDAETRRAAASRIRFEALPPVAVKGKTEPVAVYRPVARVSAEPSKSAPVAALGRERELAAIDALVAGVRAHGAEGGVVV
ncbi:MAG TPA: hypothetical protein VHB21_08600, partial [Minicystis sp.]|nr:hypothetical protein [Minicystis sp.]